MAARHKNFVLLQQRRAELADIMVGDYVVTVDPEFPLEEIDEPEISREFSRPVKQPHGVVGPHIEYWSLEGRENGAGAVVVAVVKRDTKIGTGSQGVEVLVGSGDVTEVDRSGLVVEALICVCYMLSGMRLEN